MLFGALIAATGRVSAVTTFEEVSVALVCILCLTREAKSTPDGKTIVVIR